MIDMRKTVVPKSDQLNADDLIGGSVTITITGAKEVSGDQPIAINYEGDNGKPYKPCKSMRRVMMRAWGNDALQYVGKKMTLFCDPKVKFGGSEVGGIRISHMSDVEGGFSMPITVSRASRKQYTVKPLTADQQQSQQPAFDPAALLAAGEAEAEKGIEAYKAWYEKQNQPGARDSLVKSGKHDEFKTIATEADKRFKEEGSEAPF